MGIPTDFLCGYKWMRLLRRFAPRNDKIVYRITYNVYRFYVKSMVY